MVARFSGAGLGLFAFCVTVVAGVYVQNPVTTTLSRGILALFLFFIIGFALGMAAETVVNEHERSREAESRVQESQESTKIDNGAPADGDIKDVATSLNA